MTLRHLQQQIGQLQREAACLAQRIELLDRRADHAHPDDTWKLQRGAQILRANLSALFTRIHGLEARLPTPELLSERAYNRMIALGFEVEAAEAERCTTYRAAAKTSRKPYTKSKLKAHATSFAHLTPTSFFN